MGNSPSRRNKKYPKIPESDFEYSKQLSSPSLSQNNKYDNDGDDDYDEEDMDSEGIDNDEIIPDLGNEIESDTKIAIVGTHQARMRCLLAKYFSSLKGKKNTIERFANGAIVKLVLQINQKKEYGYVELLYSGDFKNTKKKGRKYYITEEKKVDLAYNRAMKFSEEVLQNLENNYQEDVNNNNVIVFDSIGKVSSSLLNEHPTDHTYIFYFIRHGEGEHNVASRFKKMNLVDPELTKGGVESTISINKALLEDIYVECAKIDDKNVYVFSSDLYRTRETLQYSIYGLDKIFKNMDNSIHVLPCSHELNYFNSGECDKKTTISGNENKSNCKTLKYDEDRKQQDTYGCDQVLLIRNPKEHGKYKRYEKGISDPIKDSKIWNIHWKHYNDFYKGTRRNPSRKRKYCK